MRKLIEILGRSPVLCALDVALVNAGFVLAFFLRFGVSRGAHKAISAGYIEVLPLASLLALVLFFIASLYGRWQDRGRTDLVSAISAAICGTMISTMVLAFWRRQFALPRTVLLLSVPLQLALIVSVRLLLQWLHRRFPHHPRRILLVADSLESASQLLEKFMAHGPSSYVVHGPVDSRELDMLDSKLPQVHQVVVAQDAANRTAVIGHCAKHNKQVLLVPSPTDFLVLGARPNSLDDSLLLSISPPRLHPWQEFAKSLMDMVVSSLLLLFAAPVMLILYVFIPLDSRGPAIFRQVRLGRGGHPFTLMKFRTMIFDAERSSGPVLASKGDPRITRLGNFLRAARLDELPQLINVLRGEMSLIGPRPEREFFVRQFEQEMPAYVLRMAVKPGITGLAQVQGRYSSSAERKLRFDLLYICNYSLALDLKILLQTISVVMRPERAVGISAMAVPRPKNGEQSVYSNPEPVTIAESASKLRPIPQIVASARVQSTFGGVEAEGRAFSD